ncbi:MAG: general secretion pathway protein GspK [Gemmatimonadales bacterium]|nr:general secretion pathway protein GspK [Gemmatimonadales bacterium]
MIRHRPPVRPSDRRGFALIAALWLLVAFSVLGLGFSLRARTHRLAVANAIEGAAGRAAAEGALALVQARLAAAGRAVRDLGTADPQRVLDPWGQADTLVRDTLTLDGPSDRPTARPSAEALVSVVDLGARLHLNLASEDDLRRFFRGLRVDFGQSDRLAQTIADWRDADQLHRARGAERDLYLKEGRTALPADAPFARVSDLREVRGMTPEIYAKAAPYLTVLGTGRTNLASAPREVLLALPGLTEEAAAVILRAREGRRPLRDFNTLLLQLPSGPREALAQAVPALQGRVVFETVELLATATGWRDGSPVRKRVEGLFVRAGDAAFLTWTRAE